MLTAIIPTRKGSTRLPDKNVAMFEGEPLLARKVRQLSQCHMVDRVLVASDSEEYLAIARDAGATHTEWLSESLAGNTASFSNLVAYLALSVGSGSIAWTPCTAPLVEHAMYDEAICAWLDHPTADSVVMVSPERRYTMKDGQPLNYSPGVAHVSSQDMPPLHVWAGALWAATSENMYKWRYFHGPNPLLFEIPKRCGVDIDDHLDMAQALAWSQL